MYLEDLKWTHDSRTCREQQKSLFARPYKYSQLYIVQYTTVVFKYGQNMSDGFIYALEACLVNFEQS